MRKITFFLLAFFALASAQQIQAQRLGGTIGINFSNLRSEFDEVRDNVNSLAGLSIGAVGELSLTDKVVFQPSILLSRKGSKLESDSDLRTAISYLQIPLVFQYQHPLTDEVKIFGGLGPFLAFAVGGKFKGGERDVSINFGNGDDDDFRAFDFGFRIGAGVEYNKIFLALNYDLGLSNIEPDDNLGEIRTRAFNISLGYFFLSK